jgi:hypothetical protein
VIAAPRFRRLVVEQRVKLEGEVSGFRAICLGAGAPCLQDFTREGRQWRLGGEVWAWDVQDGDQRSADTVDVGRRACDAEATFTHFRRGVGVRFPLRAGDGGDGGAPNVSGESKAREIRFVAERDSKGRRVDVAKDKALDARIDRLVQGLENGQGLSCEPHAMDDVPIRVGGIRGD